MKSSYRDDLLELCEDRFATCLNVSRGKMMGHPGFKTANNGKFFMFLYEDGFSMKMPPDLYEEVMKRDDVTPFQPMGDQKPMSTWIVWSLAEPVEYLEEWNLVEAALYYTSKEPPNQRKKKKQ